MPNREIQKPKECTWCRARSFKFDNHITGKCHKFRREKEKKEKSNYTVSAATSTFTILAATNQSPEPIISTWQCDSEALSHIPPNSGDFLNSTHSDAKIIMADGRTHEATALRIPDYECDYLMEHTTPWFSPEPCMFPPFDTPWSQKED